MGTVTPANPTRPAAVLFPTLAVVGVGLIGGSAGLAARRRGAAGRVIGVGRHGEALEQARARGAVDDVCTDLRAAAAAADLVLFCTPVDRIAALALEAAPACRPGTLLTDAGSTKAGILAAVRGRLPAGVAFVGGHPLAGSERQGAGHADAGLFEGRLVVLTPDPDTNDNALSQVATFWQALGARTIVLGAEEHDRAVALTSHLPHLAAAAVAGLLPPELDGLTAAGFRDMTRVAAGDPELWEAIFHENRGPVLGALDRLAGRLDAFRAALAAGDRAAVCGLLAEGHAARHRLDGGA
jgi:prephenate dehydrogenase